MDLNGATAIVTGAASGIGAALATELVRRGARVVIADLDLDSSRAVADRLPDGSAVAVAGDTSEHGVIAAQIKAAEDAFGPVDLYFANAGIGTGAGLGASDDEWARSIDVNLLAHVRAAQALVPGWVERGGGYFVVTASAAGLLSQIGSATYSTTKHAAVGFAEWLSITYGDHGVGVSCLCPMGVETALLAPDREVGDEEALMLHTVRSAGAVLTPEAVAIATLDAVADGRFLVLPHPEVLDMYRGKGADYDRWIGGMRRLERAMRKSVKTTGGEQ
ncbi:MAG TPA: SDR family NAD(P)-dependent oxidoreductase [Gordonia sp. (in: high G+C Gram-positive bacteria)]|uniref:SDR family oxidoreductase n=1 Tax=unclassified Gordonia (in: high G+C Gram-positive bacteria) TaxID=2657482 RepID=UPI000FA3CF3A|nr:MULTISPECIES: SDR family NAD(P)-dependent oxidoreductase [unclassified Gordonia (in: high G+C Gram-positive bacteria)]RUP39637.1 MAG: SDR family NAD(P)-dependent oxidoreductase [Gordonia sp. (in: high G+C Gram-positive bacteria)]HNP56901.1 SDR family NAD(P)-dependent oxidoreductase [Gordonia sp. (in: high G+C Gram-positive bacteria)]HRC51152.1 SDR family NAD(P)-dependent oxidoreductase [Gordonia sp. (in: high G+C Gram-positive bacteria)]